MLGANADLDREDLDTYDCLQLVHGLAPVTPQYTRQVVSNRQNPKVLRAFQTLLGCGHEEFLVTQDRWCLYRPTIPENETAGEELATKMASWRTDTRLHLDMHPWKYLGGGTERESLRYVDRRDISREVSSP